MYSKFCMYISDFSMARCRGRRPTTWLPWWFSFSRGPDFKHVDKEIEYRHLERKGNHVCWSRCLCVNLHMLNNTHSVSCQIEFPPQVKIIHVYIKYLVWTGRCYIERERCLMTAHHRDKNGCKVDSGYFIY